MKEKELKQLRTLNSKHILQEDKTIKVQLYNDNIHYLDNGEYKEIDNTITEIDGNLVNKSNDFKVMFNKSNGSIEISKENKRINMYLESSNMKKYELSKNNKNKQIDKIKYINVLDNIDIIYEVHPNKLKEKIILNKKIELNELKFIFKTDLIMELNNENNIIVKDNEKEIYLIDKSFMIDGNNKVSDNLKYILDKKDNCYELTIILDKEWLNSKDRKYPVIIDPTVSHIEDSTNVIDTFITNNSKVNINNSDYLLVGVDDNYTYRTLLKFKLPEIPASYKLVDARLRLVCPIEYNTDKLNQPIISVHRLIKDWTVSNATWNNMSNEYSTEIEDFFLLVRSNNSESKSISTNYANITKLVKDWYNNPNTNYGLMLKWYKEIEEKDNNALAVFASTKTKYEGDSPKPVIEITYKNYNGVESYLSYSTQTHFFGNAYISNYTGNLTSTFEVANTVGGVLPTNLYLAYNTVDISLNNDYGYGLGIKPNLMQFIEKTEYENNPLAYTDEDGGIHYFYKIGEEDIYKDEDGLGLEIKLEDTKYIMTDKDQNKYEFTSKNNKYYLTLIEDTNGKTINIIYDNNNRITKVIDATNHEITVTYSNSKIIFTSPYKTTEVNLTNNLITSITSLGNTETITYNSNKQIETINSPSGITLKYDYINDIINKVSKVTEIGSEGEEGDYLTFSYQLSDTKVVDRKGDSNTYIFNDYGNVVGITSLDEEQKLKNAYGKTYTFGTPEEDNVNKLLTDKSLIKYVNNLISDSSFENSTKQFTSSNSNITTSICNESRTGNKALKIVSSNINSYIYKNIDVTKGFYYTYSLYVKNNVPLTVSLSYDSKKETVTITDINTEYTRYEVSINYELNANSSLKIEIQPTKVGQIIIDDIQLEEGMVANYYNLISDDLENWNIYDSENEGNAKVVTLYDNQKALQIHSTPLSELTVSKTFDTPGKAGDTYNLSFWYKNNGINPSFYAGTGLNSYCATVRMYYDDDELGTCVPVKALNVGNDNWQFFSENFIAEKDYSKIELILFASTNANDCWVTNFSLFKDLEQYSYVYDDNGNLISSTDLAKETSTMKYNQNNQLLQTMSPLGNKYTFEYDNKVTDRMIRAMSPTGITNEVIYDTNSNPVKNKINNRNILSPIDNNKTYYIRAKGTNKYFNINDNKILRVKENECSYDKFYIIVNDQNQIKFKHAILNNYYLKEYDNTIKLMYGDNNNLFELKNNENSSYSIIKEVEFHNEELDSDYIIDNAFTINDDLTITLEKWDSNNYNQQFFFEQTENKLFIESNATYTSDGRFISSVTDSLDNTYNYEYNTTNGLLNSITDPDNNTTNYTYDNKLRITNIKKGQEQVSYQYNNKNLLSKIIFGTDNYNFTYDQYNNPLTTKINNYTLITNTYEQNNGNLIKSTYGNNDVINYTYDELNRLKSIIKEDNTYTNYYDNLGRITKLTSNDINHLYEYDFASRLSTYRNSDNYVTTYEYDKDNNVIKKSEKVKNKFIYNYEYNDDNALIKLTNNKKVFNYDYDILGRLSSQNINNKYNASYKYTTGGNKTSTQIEEVNDNGTIYNYSYDKLGNITETYKDNVLTNKYYYDMYSELIKEDDLVNNLTKVYTYDNYGNILSKKVYTYNTTNLIKEDNYTYGNSNWQDLLTKFNNESITYDEIGNPLTIGTKKLTWINGRELASYKDSSNTITYKYNLDGIRTTKTINGNITKYYLEGSSIIFEDRNGSMIYYFYNGNELLGFIYNDKTYYYHKNIFGDIIGILNTSYKEIVTYEYDSWGLITNITDNSGINLSEINPFRYRSYYYDTETGLYYLNSRYYNPEWGRFINADGYVSTGQGILGNNMFAYCENNFSNLKDDGGKFGWVAALVLVGCALLVSGCSKKNNSVSKPRQDLIQSEDLNRKTAKDSEYNCYGNAISKKIVTNPTGYQEGDSTRKTYNAVVQDVGKDNVRELTSINDIIYDDENLVAIKCGPLDYHFIVRVDGIWYNKPGTTKLIENELELNVITKVWYGRYYEGGSIKSDKSLYYDDETIYFAIKKEWDE